MAVVLVLLLEHLATLTSQLTSASIKWCRQPLLCQVRKYKPAS
jgi:hypothetical protein